jgi:hypothetical protein
VPLPPCLGLLLLLLLLLLMLLLMLLMLLLMLLMLLLLLRCQILLPRFILGTNLDWRFHESERKLRPG